MKFLIGITVFAAFMILKGGNFHYSSHVEIPQPYAKLRIFAGDQVANLDLSTGNFDVSSINNVGMVKNCASAELKARVNKILLNKSVCAFNFIRIGCDPINIPPNFCIVSQGGEYCLTPFSSALRRACGTYMDYCDAGEAQELTDYISAWKARGLANPQVEDLRCGI